MSGAQECVADCLECYMEQMITNFESFVKKSLLLISLALGSVVIMAIYVLKLLSDRTPHHRDAVADNKSPVNKTKRIKITDSFSPILGNNNSSICCTSAKNPDCSVSRSSSEEKILMEIGFSNNSKPCVTCKPSLIKKFTHIRPVIPSVSLPDCASKLHECRPMPCPNQVTVTASCCSVCCDR